ncbi:MAG: hypothetical protein RSE25_04705 [Bacteroidales bacterium]
MKDISKFPASKTCTGGHRGICKECCNKKQQEWRKSKMDDKRVINPLGEKIKSELEPLKNISARLLIMELRARGYSGELIKTTIEKVVI